MRDYQPATIRYHRPTASAFESMNSKQYTHLSHLNSDSVQKYYELSGRDNNSHLYRFQSCNSLSEEDPLERQYNNLLTGLENLFKEEDHLTKHEKIRIREWLNKLSWKQSNPIWKKNINFYLKVLIEMVKQGKLSEPFNVLPGDGTLRKLTVYDLPFPLRQKFSQSKDRSKSKKSIDGSNFSQVFNISKQRVINKISTMKGFDFSQSCILDKKVAVVDQANKFKAKTMQVDYPDEFCKEIDMKMALNPVSSNQKTRKSNIQKSNQNSNKLSTAGKRNKKLPPTIPNLIKNQSSDANKENDPYSVNINRKLFKSKQKQEGTQYTMRTEYIRSDYNLSKDEDNHQIYNIKEHQESYEKNSMEDQKRMVFPKMYRLLRHNEAVLADQPDYSILVDQVYQMGKKMNLPQFNQQSLDDSTLSQSSKNFLKASEEIKCKFQQTDQQTVEFMNYLNNIKNQTSRESTIKY